MHNFTPEDLLRYLYGETSPTETIAIKAALETDWALCEKYEVITSAQSRLEAIKMSPSNKTIDAILSYAEKSVEELSAQA